VTNEQHNKYIACTFFAHAGFQVLLLIFMAAIFSMVFLIPEVPGKPAPPKEFFAAMMAFVSFFYVMFALPSVVAGYALLKHKPWARLASIIAGVVSAMSVPIGTAACVYSLWFFLGDSWKSIYPDNTGQSHGEPRQIPYGAESQRAAYEAEKSREKIFNAHEPPDWR
jgi:amino acid transporter